MFFFTNQRYRRLTKSFFDFWWKTASKKYLVPWMLKSPLTCVLNAVSYFLGHWQIRFLDQKNPLVRSLNFPKFEYSFLCSDTECTSRLVWKTYLKLCKTLQKCLQDRRLLNLVPNPIFYHRTVIKVHTFYCILYCHKLKMEYRPVARSEIPGELVVLWWV